ncbi:purple acid phosphatase family protein [Paractinoplanes ferrugineus]|nr:metallophosphoesterase family protein [Actinoplanes ferrugineus]
MRSGDLPRMGVPDDLAVRLSLPEQHEYLTRSLRRRTLFGAAAGGAVAVKMRSPAFARQGDFHPGRLIVPFGRHLAWGANPRTQMRIGWQVPDKVRHPYVRVGDSPAGLGDKIPAEIRPLHTEVKDVIAATDQFYVHAAIDGLEPGRTYFYVVGHHGFEPTDLAEFGRIDTFTTAPTRTRVAEPFTFTAFGDQGVSPQALHNDSRIAAQKPVFHLHAGDLCYADASGKGELDDLYNPTRWDQFLAQNEPIAATVPWMATLGNHDMEAIYSPHGYGGQLARWEFPGNGPAKAVGSYSFVYGNVGVVALDANDISFEITVNRGYTHGAQTAWLDERLKWLRAQPDVDFVVVFFHYCAYSTTVSHASDGAVRNMWVPLFDKYGVDLVINGHNHIYERADTMKAGRSTRTPIGATVHPGTDGTTYVTAGAGGRGLYEFSAPDTYAGHERGIDAVKSFVWNADGDRVDEIVPWSRVRYTGYSFLAVDVRPAHAGRTATMTLRAVTEKGAEIDRLVLARTAGDGSRLHLSDDAG